MLARVPEGMRSRLTENSLIAKETLKIASTSDVGANDAQITDLVMDHMDSRTSCRCSLSSTWRTATA